jgi:tRNA pseudouridine32 synthase / 23S rRNA pseudouridine746 synthase
MGKSAESILSGGLDSILLFEDDCIVAVNKPSGISSIPDRSADTLDMRQVTEQMLDRRLWVVHRIDKPVSGVLVFAKTEAVHKELNVAFESRRVQKEYLTLVHGFVRGKRGRVDSALRSFGSGRVGVDEERGKESLTEYVVIDSGDEYSLLRVFPRSGRRHQIRAHLYSRGHPIVGDLLYGEKLLQQGYERLMLHAHRLRLPFADRPDLEVVSNPPVDFVRPLGCLTGSEELS